MTSRPDVAGGVQPRLVWAMLGAFACIFLAGFFERPPNLFLLPLGAYVCGAVVVIYGTLGGPDGAASTLAVIIGAASLVFSAGLLYGAGGIWWGYEVIDVLYVSIVIAAAIAYLVSSVAWLRVRAAGAPRRRRNPG